eukprot:TRINITY_DN22185_c0_g1_i1.p1 TRINITY_DN22185_c0_g1~~TRINITY_DN22185_c0_g1_i1.p1  ORF type:complete len:682 (+),score=134.04 TRINITY_DN22185_c0_g1_i1:57-2102(+)
MGKAGGQGARGVVSAIISCCLFLFAVAVILTIGVTVFLVLWFTHSAGLNPENTDPPSYTSLPSKSPSRSPTQSLSSSLSITSSLSLSASSSTTPSLSNQPSQTPSISITPSTTPSLSISASITPTISITPSRTPSISITASPSQSRPSTTSTASISASISVTPSRTPSNSISRSATPSRSFSPSASPKPYTLMLSALTTSQGFPIYGANPADASGGTVASAGDINGDGRTDWLFGTKGHSPNGTGTGLTHLVYGVGGVNNIDLQSVTTNGQGLVFTNANNDPFKFTAVSAAGDFNNDGVQDFMIGSEGGSPTASRNGAGEGYIIYGKQGLSSVNLANLGTSGTNTWGSVGSDFSHNAVAGGKDLNGDGVSDILIGAWKAQKNQNGLMYVVYGEAGAQNTATVDLNSTSPSLRTWTILGNGNSDYCGESVAFAGDFNNDGSQDALMGCGFLNNQLGGVYVISGGTGIPTTGNVNVTNIATATLFIGILAFDRLGVSVSTAGDFNGDGITDIVISASGGSGASGNRYNSGIVYVIFGKTGGYGPGKVVADNLDATQAVKIWGAFNGDYLGNSVSFAGDVNGDGLDDIVIGCVTKNSAYIIFGRRGGYSSYNGGVIDLGYLTADVGIQINGAQSGDGLGSSVASAGDVNRDGYADVLIGASKASPRGRNGAGQSYVIYGRQSYV